MIVSLSSLHRTRDRWREQLQAARTRDSYEYGWQKFLSWCNLMGCKSLPAESETVELFVVWCLQERRYRFATVELCLAGIADRHRRESYLDVVKPARFLLRCARRQWTEQPHSRKPLTLDQLRAISRQLDETGRPIDVRNRALLVLGFAAGWRGGELAALQMWHLQFREEQELILWQPRSKTDQEGHGREVSIPCGASPETCPVRLLAAWIKIRGPEPGSVFSRFNGRHFSPARGIRRDQINEVVKESLRRIGEDAERFGSHSLRAGMITTAAECGAPEIGIMHRSGLKKINTVLRYVRPTQGLRFDPLRGVL
jgi:integrase